ncbi:DUF4440 domain-containing protein [Clostridium sp. MB40-C1]|uniref:nuclear transport factor 2 family protein n=1 Tax=Clostridium sp. MB40-C1 TaxID=3070996 RepID=UPI0027E06859|nr:DUF4440 domain-containing protein [Clostridium sp. MB40-C1]WMJ81653.1 DUF4440 domain-containing protein [Clostridium sp. MB40-C1]
MNSIKEHILELENDLLKLEVRKSAQKINDILANDFIEFTSSGCEYHYKSGDIFQRENDNNQLLWQIIDFQIRQLSEDCILAMYKVIKHDELNENKKYTLRSSIWKCIDEKWKMIFHQGTGTAKIDI